MIFNEVAKDWLWIVNDVAAVPNEEAQQRELEHRRESVQARRN
jgi:hypothetical protein